MRVLVINPGSTSTKIAVFDDRNEVFTETIRHSTDELSHFKSVLDQKFFRKEKVITALIKNNISVNSLDAVIGRGGIVKPISAGTYFVSDALISDLEKFSAEQEHPSTLGGLIAYEIARDIDKPSFIADPVCVDEFEDIARISGLKEIKRRSLLHALNIRASMYRYAEALNKNINDLNLIVAHLGGGISIAAIKDGKIIDVNNANEAGPFSPERTGSIPSIDVVNMAYSGNYNRGDLLKLFTKKGGLVSYLGTNNMEEVLLKIKRGDSFAKEVFEALCYQIAKEIGAMATVLEGNVETIIITGGLAYNEEVIDGIKNRVKFIAPIVVYPGEFEMEALAYAALRVLNGDEKANEYI
jgi:butyrate kinase